MRSYVAVATILAGLFTSADAQAYNFLRAWNGGAIKYQSNMFTLQTNPTVHARYRQVVNTAAQRINLNSSNAWVNVVIDDDNFSYLRNSENEVNWVSQATFRSICGPTAGSACAPNHYSHSLQSSTRISESDVVVWGTETPGLLNTNSTDSELVAQLWGYSSPAARPLVNTLLHEIGHCLGLQHESRVYSIMGIDWTHNTSGGMVTYADLGSDSISGLNSVFGSYEVGRWEDVQVSHWKYAGNASGEYANHKRTEAWNTVGGNLNWNSNWRAGAPNPIFVGTPVIIDATLENNGYFRYDVDVEWVFSSDFTIDASDMVLARATYRHLRPGNPAPGDSPSLQMPAAMRGVSGIIGVRIDPANRIAEVQEWNNSAWLFRVTVF